MPAPLDPRGVEALTPGLEASARAGELERRVAALERGILAAAGGAAAPLLTVAEFLALGAQPNGTEVAVLVDATAGVVWRFRYRAASASASKWETVGGGPLRASSATQATLGAVAYTAIATPSLTLPLAGDYAVRVDSTGYILAAALAFGVVATVAGTAGADADATWTTSTSNQGETGSRGSLRAAAAGAALATAGRVVVATTNGGISYYRGLEAFPVRVTGP